MLEKIQSQIKTRFAKMSPMRMIVYGYFILILLGAFLLMLPIASQEEGTTLKECLFTAVSATCVTGLVLVDTCTHWSLFGQLVIIAMIQIGGIGFLTLAISALSLTKVKLGLRSRFIMQQSVSALHMGGIIKMTRFIVVGSLTIEGIGALLLSIAFCPKLGLLKGIYYGIWHSVSAFCNAGFDLMGFEGKFSSLTSVYDNPLVNITIMLLIVIGGIGFFVWSDFVEHRFHLAAYHLSTKLVLIFSGALIVGGALIIFLFEYHGEAYEELGLGSRILASFFQSVSCRTAGFNTIDLASIRSSTQLVMIVLMFIGGSTASTAGGLKVTTFAVLFLTITTMLRKKRSIEVFGRRLEETLLFNASCLLMLYLMLSLVSAVVISAVDSVPVLDCLYETVSAVATVGLTVGITTSLSTFSHVILMILMFIGRIGGITMLLALSKPAAQTGSRLPVEKMTIG